MSTKGTVTLAMQTFASWNGDTTGAATACTAKGSIKSNDTSKITMEGSDTTDFTIVINKHGSNTSLAFVIDSGELASTYSSFIPIGIALKQTAGTGDPLGTNEFPEVTIEADKNDNIRTLTLDVAQNETATWEFYLVIQGVPCPANGTYPVGIIDPKIRGSATQ